MQPFSLDLPYHRLMPCNLQALSELQICNIKDPYAIEIHVDGSGAADCACWSLVALWQDYHGQWFYGGSKVASVITDPMESEYVGAAGADSNSAELTAML